MNRTTIFSISIGISILLSLAWIVADQETPWIVPDEYESMKNPVAVDDASIKTGKTLYSQHCKSCHGKEGLGDGSKAAQLETPAGDFTSDEFIEQSDGALLYKSWIGRDEMPNFEKKVPDEEDIWHLVNYMRYLSDQ